MKDGSIHSSFFMLFSFFTHTYSSNPFTPKVMYWTLPSSNLSMSISANREPILNQKRYHSVAPDELARYEQSHLDLHSI